MPKGFRQVNKKIVVCAILNFRVYLKKCTFNCFYLDNKIVFYVVTRKNGRNTYFMQNEFYYCVKRVCVFLSGCYYE